MAVSDADDTGGFCYMQNHAIMNYSERIRFLLFITSVALKKNPFKRKGKRWRKTTAWKTAQ